MSKQYVLKKMVVRVRGGGNVKMIAGLGTLLLWTGFVV